MVHPQKPVYYFVEFNCLVWLLMNTLVPCKLYIFSLQNFKEILLSRFKLYFASLISWDFRNDCMGIFIIQWSVLTSKCRPFFGRYVLASSIVNDTSLWGFFHLLSGSSNCGKFPYNVHIARKCLPNICIVYVLWLKGIEVCL